MKSLFNLGQSVEEIEIKNSKVYSVKTEKSYLTDILIGSADYHHIEKNLLPKSFRNYSEIIGQKKLSPLHVYCFIWNK